MKPIGPASILRPLLRDIVPRSIRRALLDELLYQCTPELRGQILDIGGQRVNRRSRFVPSAKAGTTWEFVNSDAKAEPDYLCDATSIPVEDGHYDVALMCEILEHLESPDLALTEASRVLKNNGLLILSMPFLYPFHPDPIDCQRWTESKIASSLKAANFKVVRITPMGGLGAVMHDGIRSAIVRERRAGCRLTGGLALRIIRPHAQLLDRAWQTAGVNTTGYFVVARKGVTL